MTADAIKKMFGDEYPDAVIVNGVRLPLYQERRFSRSYRSDEPKLGSEVSRFMEGSASITASELLREWHTWTDDQRMDFCQSCGWLYEQSDFRDMLRFIMQYGGPDNWSAVAIGVGTRLPQAEAFELLTRALRSTDLSEASNISQGISLTKHPDAERVLRAHLAALWSHPSLWDDAEFNNWLAYGATCCIDHLIAVGAPAQDFREQVRELAAHPCSRNRDSCRRFLGKHFPWLSDETNTTGTT